MIAQQSLTGISRSRLLLLTFVMAIFVAIMAQAMSLVSADSAFKKIGKGTHYLVETAPMTIDEVMKLGDKAWQTEQDSLLSFGMTPSPYWFKETISDMPARTSWLIELDYPLIDHFEIWMMNQHQQVIAHYETGDQFPFANRPVPHEKFLFPISTKDEQSLTLYFRAKTSGVLKLPLYVWRSSDFAVFNGEHNIVMGLFFGFATAMALSNFFFFMTSRNTNFLFYSGYVASLGLVLGSLHGLGYKYIWPEFTWLQHHGIAIFANMTVMFGSLFTYYLLDVSTHLPKAAKVLRVISITFAVTSILSIVTPYDIAIKVTLVLMSLGVSFIYGVGIWLSISGVKVARIYTVAWSVLFAGGLLASIENLNIADVTFNSHYLLMLGGCIETILLALVLAMNYNAQREEMQLAQETMLKNEIQLREARENVISLQQEAQQELEYKVEERTLELEITLRELQEANNELEQRNTIDSLTGIRNRRYFDKKYVAEIRRSRREQTELAVCMIDIDHFKKVNDTHGHLVGDECIRHVATTLKQALKRPSDEVCRYGGEEFAIILPNTNQHGAQQLLEEMRNQIANQPIHSAVGDLSVTISAGFSSAIVPMHCDEMFILESADKALYQAKQQGRNRVIYRESQPANPLQELS